jgi:TRAP-type uncharacterized transport system substrate-binding protein
MSYEPFVPPAYNLRAPATMRGVLMLEVAAELVKMRSWPHNQPLIHLRAQGAGEWAVTLFGSDSPEAVHQVARKEVQFAIVNPGAILALAIRGLGPFPDPVPVRAVAVLPQYDQLGFAVTEATGLTTLTELRDRRYPLRVTLRAQRDHAQHVVIREVLSALGMTVEDIPTWGGQLIYERPTPDGRIETVRSGKADSLWDEAMPMYGAAALEMGMRFLTLEPAHRERLEAMGLRATSLKERYPQLTEDIWCIDFSGWTIYTHEDTADDIVEAFCTALEVRKDRIPYRHPDGSQLPEGAPLPLDEMCRSTPDGPLSVPLHPAAERFWRGRGYLP